MAKIPVKYSTKFFCPHCKRESGETKMLILDEEIDLLRCYRHKSYMKQCDCRTTDLIVSGYYDDPDITEEEINRAQEDIESLPDITEEEARKNKEDRLEEDYANLLKEAWSGNDVIGFE